WRSFPPSDSDPASSWPRARTSWPESWRPPCDSSRQRAAIATWRPSEGLLSSWNSRSLQRENRGRVNEGDRVHHPQGRSAAEPAPLSAPPGFCRGLGHPLVTYGVLMFPAAALSGASFPLAVRLAVKDPELAAFGAGRISMLNTLGGIAGALGAGFLGLPRLG